jgi:hypothetical protein
MRQMLGRQAEFTDPRTGVRERVAAFRHDVSAYVNGGLRAGLRLVSLGEWRDAGAGPTDAPRLLSVHFQLPARTSEDQRGPARTGEDRRGPARTGA